jgi:hypothetical protein
MSIWLRLRSWLLGSSQPASAATPELEDSPDGDGRDSDPSRRAAIAIHNDGEAEKAARLRILQVERALRGAKQREGEVSAAEPPWARGKNRPGRLPSGPGRPYDAAFVLTVVLHSELPSDAAALSQCLDSPVWVRPSVRLIPLIRNGVPEGGFAAELLTAEHRAFLVYRQQPYGEAGGNGHVGLFIGGPGTRPGTKEDAHHSRQAEEGLLLAALARSLLLSQPDALGLVFNREGHAWMPREQALTALAPPEGAPTPA